MKSNRQLLGFATVLLASAVWTGHASGQTYTWGRGVAGTFSWNNDALAGATNGNNWGATPTGDFPHAAGAIANLGNNAGTNVSVINLGQGITIGSISNIGSTNGNGSRTIAAGGSFSLTFDNNLADSTILKLNNTNTSAAVISAPVLIAGNGNLVLTNNSATTLTLSGGVASALASGTQKLSATAGVINVSDGVGNGSSGGTVELDVSGGTLTLSAGNTYSGATTISGGILTLGGTAGSLSTSSAITNNAVLSIARTNAVTQGTDFSGSAISGTGEVRAIGTGLNLTLNTANTYQGNTSIGTSQNNSVVRATASGALGSGTIQFDTAGNASTARLELSGGITLNNAAIGIAGRSASTAAIQNITGNNTLSGDIGLQAGGTHYVAQSDSGELTLSGGIANASGTGTRTFTVTGDGIGLLSGSITNGTGTTALTKAGGGTWTISGTNNSYTGATLASAGTLLVNGSLGDTAVSVAADATIGGTGSLAGGLAFDAAGLLEVVDLNDPLTVGGTITFGSGFGIANLTGINWGSLDLNTAYTVISTSQSFSASDIGNFGIDNAALVGGGRSAYFDNGSLAVVVIPEPAAAVLGGIGVFFLLRRRR